MDFKFSCKWFEVSFSGDPGYVEKQIEKYEPYILQALKQMEIEQQEKESKRTETGTALPPVPEPQENSRRDSNHTGKRRKNHSGRGRPSEKKDRSSTHTYRKDYTHENSSRSDYIRPLTEADSSTSETKEKEEDDSLPFAERGDENPSPHKAATDPGEKQETDQQKHDSGADADPSAHEFPARRKTPRIKAEDLVRTIDDKRPRTHHDRVMVFGHYMETEGGGSDFTIPEIKRCYRAANQDPGNNIEQVINHATRSGFIIRHNQARTNRFKLSAKGRRYVEDGLKLT